MPAPSLSSSPTPFPQGRVSKKNKAKKSSSSSTPPPPPALEESGSIYYDELRLSQASARFPNFIGETAFVGRVSYLQDPDDPFNSNDGNKARVWLSTSVFNSSSSSSIITTGSLVSVSLPSADEISRANFPLDSLLERCCRHFNVDVGVKNISGAGNYFAIATVFPSSKVPKDGVGLSWALSCTMGVPAAGKPIIVFPMNGCQQTYKHVNVTPLDQHKSTDLYLKHVSNKGLFKIGTSRESASVTGDIGMSASPKTPSFQLKRCTYGTSSSSASIKTPSFQLKRCSYSTGSVHPSEPHDSKSDPTTSVFQDISPANTEMLHLYSSRWLYDRYLLNGNIVTIPLMFGQICVFLVEGTDKLLTGCNNTYLMNKEADAARLVDRKTIVHLFDHTSLDVDRMSLDVGACDIPKLGGLSKEISALKEIIMFSLMNKDHFLRYKGVLLHGPPGTGKTSLARSCAHNSGVNLFSINGTEIMSQNYGEIEKALHEVFDSARQAVPAMVFIDELDVIAPTQEDKGEGLYLRTVSTLLKLMDEIKKDDAILVIAATNRPDCIDPAMRRPGRLDREIEIGVPSPEQRLDILHTLLSGMNHSLSNDEVRDLASSTHGFVGADLADLCNEAAMIALRRYIKVKNSDRNVDGACADSSSSFSVLTVSPPVSIFPISSQSVHGYGNSSSHKLNCISTVEKEAVLTVTTDDFEMSKLTVRPWAMREVMLRLSKVRWEDVGGQKKVKEQLMEAIQWPQSFPDAFKRIGICPPRGLLMIGPPGCSKTLMARAVTSEAKLNFFAVKGPELFNKWVGESEKAVRSLFAKARANSPAIIFFDEIDGLAISRGRGNDGTSVTDRVVTQLLVEMDGLGQRVGVTVLAATNRPDKIDPALLRPGRFDRILDVQPPDENDREEIFRIYTRIIPCHPDVSMKELAWLTESYTGADIKSICRRASVTALEESLEASEVCMEHFKIGIGRVRPSDVQFYKDLAAEFRRIVDK